MTTTAITIDCETCPGRGRLCGDCFVPVLGRIWLETPTRRDPPASTSSRPHPEAPAPGSVGLDSEELSAVGAFVRAGLVQPEEADRARATLTKGASYAAG